MKRCTICKQFKSVDAFGRNKTKQDGKQTYCTLCSRNKDKLCYNNNFVRKKKIKSRREIIYLKNAKIIYNWLSSHPCVDCGETDPIVLEFDHLRDKLHTVATCRSLSTETLLAEINKCEIRCANCHRRRHAKENNWYSNILNVN